MIGSMKQIITMNSTVMLCWEKVEVGGVIIILVVVLVVLFLSLGVIICAREAPSCDCCHQTLYGSKQSVVSQGRRRGYGVGPYGSSGILGDIG